MKQNIKHYLYSLCYFFLLSQSGDHTRLVCAEIRTPLCEERVSVAGILTSTKLLLSAFHFKLPTDTHTHSHTRTRTLSSNSSCLCPEAGGGFLPLSVISFSNNSSMSKLRQWARFYLRVRVLLRLLLQFVVTPLPPLRHSPFSLLSAALFQFCHRRCRGCCGCRICGMLPRPAPAPP